MARLIIYQGEQLATKQIAEKYHFSQGWVSHRVNHYEKLDGHEISWVNPPIKKEENSTILRKERLVHLLELQIQEETEKINALQKVIDFCKKDIDDIKEIRELNLN